MSVDLKLTPKRKRQAGIVDSERRGSWAYCDVNPKTLEELTAWLS